MKQLSLSQLNAAYERGCFHKGSPTHIRLHVSREKETWNIFYSALRFVVSPKDTQELRLNTAVIVFSPEVSSDVIEVVNVKWMHHCERTFSVVIKGDEVCDHCGQRIPDNVGQQ